MDPLVTTQWLAGEIGSADLVVLDCTYTSTLPGSPPRDPRAEFVGGHIPGTRFLDLDTLVDENDPLPSMLPRAERFTERMRMLGITADSRVLLYDNGPHATSCRAWWVLGMYGVKASLLDGGIAKWRNEGHAIDTGEVLIAASDFTAGTPVAEVRTLDQMRTTTEQIVDARSPERFTGEELDPRPGCGSGHMPGAKNIRYTIFFNPDGTWKSREQIAAIFADAGVDPAKPMVTTCGSGITAAVVAFAAHVLGHRAALYDGSWSEWGALADTPKVTGA